MSVTCLECQYAKMLPDLNNRVCRRFPPQVHLAPGPGGGIQQVTLWPLVTTNDLCGEFKRRLMLEDGAGTAALPKGGTA